MSFALIWGYNGKSRISLILCSFSRIDNGTSFQILGIWTSHRVLTHWRQIWLPGCRTFLKSIQNVGDYTGNMNVTWACIARLVVIVTQRIQSWVRWMIIFLLWNHSYKLDWVLSFLSVEKKIMLVHKIMKGWMQWKWM